MRLLGKWGLAMVVAAGAAWALAPAATGAITGTAHDLSGQTYTNQICEPCHTPHNSNSTITAAPLWNHTISTATYVVYSTTTFNGGTPSQPSGVSKLCLGCHDGTVSIDSFGSSPTTTHTLTSSDDQYLGTDLSNDHPVSFSYMSSDAVDAEIQPIATPVAAGLVFFGTTNTVECATCHDVHATSTVAGTPLLRRALSGSQICLDCHDK